MYALIETVFMEGFKKSCAPDKFVFGLKYSVNFILVMCIADVQIMNPRDIEAPFFPHNSLYSYSTCCFHVEQFDTNIYIIVKLTIHETERQLIVRTNGW